ncbi:glutathione S-transferase family protein [Seohaeicola saemankumensis]|nr:glutathione S-transferase family protein [Seohaeicola saemankumensis]MCA0871513.1 glutathione S-transferase family protein [Seohaeicola saemankumensis]
MSDLTLFAAPGTCARVPCIALEEAGADYTLRLVRFMKGEHRSPDFLALNPKGKVPTLLIGDQPLTENVAIARYLAARFPQARLLPTGDTPLEEAQITADLSFCAATLHPIVTRIRMPAFMVEGDTAQASVRATAIAAMLPMAQVIADRVSGGRWWYGDDWSLVDAYLYWVWFRITGAGFPADDHPAWAAHAARMETRPAVQRALQREAEMQAQLETEGLVFRPT